MYELNGFIDNEYTRFSRSNFQGFRDEYDRILKTFSVLEAHIADDTKASLIATDAMLIPLFDDAILPDYLILDDRQYRNEMLGIVLRLTHQVVQADWNLIRNTV